MNLGSVSRTFDDVCPILLHMPHFQDRTGGTCHVSVRRPSVSRQFDGPSARGEVMEHPRHVFGALNAVLDDDVLVGRMVVRIRSTNRASRSNQTERCPKSTTGRNSGSGRWVVAGPKLNVSSPTPASGDRLRISTSRCHTCWRGAALRPSGSQVQPARLPAGSELCALVGIAPRLAGLPRR